jgi:hypothetical protein
LRISNSNKPIVPKSRKLFSYNSIKEKCYSDLMSESSGDNPNRPADPNKRRRLLAVAGLVTTVLGAAVVKTGAGQRAIEEIKKGFPKPRNPNADSDYAEAKKQQEFLNQQASPKPHTYDQYTLEQMERIKKQNAADPNMVKATPRPTTPPTKR